METVNFLFAVLLAAQDDRVSELIQQLDSDDAAQREHATAELIKIGKPALPAARKAQKESTSAEVRTRAEQIVNGYCELELRKIYEARLPKERRPHLGVKPLNCREDIEKYFPGYRFYLITLTDETPSAGAMLTPDNEIVDYALKIDRRNGETELLTHVKKAGVAIKDREDAKSFGLLWLLLAYGTDEFKVETTDHQNETRY